MKRPLFAFIFSLIFAFCLFGKGPVAQITPDGSTPKAPIPPTTSTTPQMSFEEKKTIDTSSPSTMPFGPWQLDWQRYQASKNYDPQWDSLVREGLKAYGEGHLEATYTFLSQATDKGCRDGIVFYYLAKQQEDVDNVEAAIRYYILSWMVIADQYPDLHYQARISSQLGQYFFAQQKFDKAIYFCKPVVDQYPGELQLTYLVAVAYYQLGQYGAAIYYFENIIANHPNHLQSRQLASLSSVEIAKIYCAKGVTKECNEYIYKALFFDPNNQTAKAMQQQYSTQQGQGSDQMPKGDADKMLRELMRK